LPTQKFAASTWLGAFAVALAREFGLAGLVI